MKAKKIDLEDRYGLKMNLISNLNYYGNLEAKLYGEPFKSIVNSTVFEELGCTSYHPAKEELRSSIKIKKVEGYLGNFNQQGSYEYVRYYIDYENNGTWEDVGVTSVKVHNVENHEGLCYGIKLKITPTIIRACNESPVLPKVRAILSWNIVPPANTPNYTPIWGNVKEANIQIAPKQSFLLPNFDLPVYSDFTAFPTINKLPIYNTKKSWLPLNTLKGSYAKETDGGRLMSMSLKNINAFSLKDIIKWQTKFKFENIDFTKELQILKTPQFNTAYEELTCVSFSSEFSELHADIHIKKSAGYSGNLCSNGSREFVAFYMDFGSGWKFMGTSSVKVFDVEEMPVGGLWYTVFLPVDLAPYEEEISASGKAKIKGILSWNTPPEPENAEYVSAWGDWEICETGLKELVLPTSQTVNKPEIVNIGGIKIGIINQVTGLAKGVSSGIEADYSPFDGKIKIKGVLWNPVEDAGYKIMIKEPSSSVYGLKKEFPVEVTELDSISGMGIKKSILQKPTDGYYDYLPNSTTHVTDSLLGEFTPTESGIHEIYIESDTGQRSDETVRFMVDKDAPIVDINITNGTGNCGKFTKGTEVSGTFKVENDTHLNEVSLWLAPNNSAAAIEITDFNISAGDTGTKTNSKISVNDTDSDLDSVEGTWKINTSTLVPCGYTVHIGASDRTIVNSNSVGKSSSGVSKGFCLE